MKDVLVTNSIISSVQPHIMLSDAGYDGVGDAWTAKLVYEYQFTYRHEFSYESSELHDVHFDKILLTEKAMNRTAYLGWLDKLLVRLRWFHQSKVVNFEIHSMNEDDALAVAEKVKTWFTEVVVEETNVEVNFWAMSNDGPRVWSRSIEVPTWEEIHKNYTHDVNNEVDRIMRRSFTVDEGKLILFYGPAGTGKTFVIRSLLREWKKYADLAYIMDPEKYFSSSPDYMLDTLFRASTTNGQGKCKLLILEDTGELLQANAKEKTGQGLSRLLNLVDGLIGQGLNIITLITSNEKLTSFHPAVVRPGRCLARIEFNALSIKEANTWLQENKSTQRVDEPKTLAELYAILHDHHIRSEDESISGQYL